MSENNPLFSTNRIDTARGHHPGRRNQRARLTLHPSHCGGGGGGGVCSGDASPHPPPLSCHPPAIFRAS